MSNLRYMTRTSPRFRLAAGSAVLLALLAITGCASDAEGDGSPTSLAPSDALAEWSAEVEAICQSYDAEAEVLVFPDQSDDGQVFLDEASTYLQDFEALLIAQREEVGAVEIPEGQADDAAPLLDILDEQIEQGEALMEVAAGGDVPTFLAEIDARLGEFVPQLNATTLDLNVPGCGSAL